MFNMNMEHIRKRHTRLNLNNFPPRRPSENFFYLFFPPVFIFYQGCIFFCLTPPPAQKSGQITGWGKNMIERG